MTITIVERRERHHLQYRTMCGTCKSVFDFHKEDLSVCYDPNIRFYKIKCPVCSTAKYLTKLTEANPELQPGVQS